jgi:hypothetical protein
LYTVEDVQVKGRKLFTLNPLYTVEDVQVKGCKLFKLTPLGGGLKMFN